MAPKELENITMEIRDFLGIKYQVVTFGPDGIVATGSNGIGKTTIERAWDAGTLGFDVEDIAIGAELGKIVISAGDFILTRQVKRNGADKVTVSEDGGKSEWKTTVQTRINDKFGRTLKPIAFMHADKKKQLEMVKEACPVGEITVDDLKRWLGDIDTAILKEIKAPKIEGKDGLEAVEDWRDVFYDARTTANSDVKAKAADLKTAEHNAKAAHDAIPSGVTILPVEKAKANLAAAEGARTALVTRTAQVAEQEKKAAGTRERIAKLRADAERLKISSLDTPKPTQIGLASCAVREAQLVVDNLKRELEKAERFLESVKEEWRAMKTKESDASAAAEEASRVGAQADELEASLTAVAIAPVTAAETASAESAVATASEAHSLAIYGEQMHAMELLHSNARATHDAAKDKAEALDKVVTTLTEVAPKELIERSGGIPGMTITDEGVTLDGKAYANLCGKEQMFFAVELTKRARRGKVKVIPVDSLETLDEEARVEFIMAAVDGGWKIVGTLVTGGPLTIIELDTAKEIPAAITPIKTLEKRLTEVKQ